jgi:hypothetical protein
MPDIPNPTGSNAEIDFENGKLKRVFPPEFWVLEEKTVEWAVTSPGQEATVSFREDDCPIVEWTSENTKNGKIKGTIKRGTERKKPYKYSVTAGGDTIDPHVGVRR